MQPSLVSHPGTSPSSPSCMMRVQMHSTIPSWQSFILNRIETYMWILFLTSLVQLSHFSHESCYDSHHPTVLRSSLTPRTMAISCSLLQTVLISQNYSFTVCFVFRYKFKFSILWFYLLPKWREILFSQEIYHCKLHSLRHFGVQPLFRSFCCLFSILRSFLG